MPIETIDFSEKGSFLKETYPLFQTSGFAARFAFPFAKEVCKGIGLDVGTGKDEWCFPGALPIDPKINQWDAMNIPKVASGGGWDYIFSSHCLEHLDRWVDVLDYWFTHLRDGGVLFLYLPDQSQKYWLPWNNRKHVSVFTPEIIQWYLHTKAKKVFVSGVDLNNSFIAIAEK